MLLKSIRLSNIRSYADEKIEFPEGSVVLSGDIGSGKSTILLGIEFALFGLKKGDISGASLLRHGKREGFVELVMDIDGKNVEIRRTLKRILKDIRQDSGYIIIDGVKKIGTAEELKAVILGLLGYPMEFIKKKELVYRYTVYTPQEEMKRIIYENKELRLDTLRRVFNIDKYKRVTENSKILVASLREKKRSIEGYIADLGQKRRELDYKENELLNLSKKTGEILPQIEELKNKISSTKKVLEALEGKINLLMEHKRNLSILEASLNNRIEQARANLLTIKELDFIISRLAGELKGRKITDETAIINLIREKEKEISEAEDSYRSIIKKVQEIKSGMELSNNAIEKIQRLNYCPLCEQEVRYNHKENIKLREGKKLKELGEKIIIYSGEEKNAEAGLNRHRKEMEDLRKISSELELLKLKAKNLEERKAEREKTMSIQEQIKREIGSANSEKLRMFGEMEKLRTADAQFNSVKNELDGLLNKEKILEIEAAKLEKEASMTVNFVDSLKKEIVEKENALEELKKINNLQNWAQDYFVKLMGTIEKHVFTQIHNDFSEFFSEWFKILIEDEMLSVGLDDEFTPVVEQDGYDAAVENLSGGEKTAVALSYRLALNRVINDMISEIKTKDIIILDEPTEGFSSEQLDKLREVVNLLNVRQVIIVSHEAKIESFAENILRVEKEGHVSSVMAG